MGGFILRRLAISIPLIIVSSFVVFLLVAAAGDPLAELRGNPNTPKSTIEARRHQLHLDKPVLVRYGMWAKGAIHGDFGRSFVTGEKVGPKLWRAIGVTMRLLAGSVLLAVLFGVMIGVVAALRQYSKFDYLATLFAFIFFSMPVFWLAAVLKDVGIRINEAVGHTWFFTVGEESPGLAGSFVHVWSDRLGHLVLPALSLILIQVAGWSRYQRASMLEVLNADYVRTAKAKGLPPGKVIVRHALRNALIPVVTLVAIDFGLLLSGAVITETVFAWSGMGRLLITGLQRQDINVVQAWLLVSATMVIVFNLVADVLYGYLDPRIRRA
ncbi:MAG TPA: ABC transporter permease [Acidimicrobiia bacterium]|jgi:peptide/nickel transport system permease protein